MVRAYTFDYHVSQLKWVDFANMPILICLYNVQYVSVYVMHRYFLSKYKDMYRKKINKGTTMFPLSNV